MTVVPITWVLLACSISFLAGVLVAVNASANAIDDWLDEQKPYAPARDAYTDRILDGLRRK